MKVYTSIASRKPMLYHKSGCPYEKRIKYKNYQSISIYDATDKGLCSCKYCDGLFGDIKVNKDELNEWSTRFAVDFNYDKRSNTLFVRTLHEFWKIYEDRNTGEYLLFHKNYSYPNMPFEDCNKGKYHRQKDVAPTFSLIKLIRYVSEHDKAKEIIKEDYRLLPRRTNKQKKYYRIAEKKVQKQARRNEMSRLFTIFETIESQNKGYKELSYC